MKKILLLFLTTVSSAQVIAADPKPDVALSRIDCGRFEQFDMAWYDDTVFDGAHRDAVVGCYVIRHGSQFMLWDVGIPVGLSLNAGAATWRVNGPQRSVKDVLAGDGIKPEHIKVIGASHNHYDHLGQAADFPHAKLIIGAEDWMNVKNRTGPGVGHFAPRTAVQPWLDNEANVEPLVGDKDIFGDGSVVMLNTPGHTPGHHSLFVRLKDRGAILISGDLYEWRQTFETDAVPKYDYIINRADQLASYDRFKKIARKLKATVIIQHEPADVAKLPAFPDWSR